MPGDDFRVGTKVEVVGKDLRGVVAFSGLTSFASGKWIGVVLDQPNGKNNGTVQGKTYFSCQDNYGIFVRPNQLSLLEEAPPSTPAKATSKLAKPTSASKSSGLKPPRAAGSGSSSSLAKSTSQVSLASDAGDAKSSASAKEEKTPKPTVEPVKKQEVADLPPEPVVVITPDLPPAGNATTDAALVAENESLRVEIQDLTEKLNTIKVKRAEDRDKLKDYGTLKMQASMIPEYKTKLSELQKELQAAQKKAEEAESSYNAKVEEYQDVGDTLEMLTLDKEMAEEKCDTLKYENETLILRVNELESDLKVIKDEIKTKGTEGVASDYEYKQLEAQNTRQKEALLRLRELMAEQNAVKDTLEKENKRLDAAVTSMSAEKDKLAAEKKSTEEEMNNLRESVDAAFGSEKMIEMLTAKNLELEDKCGQQEETIAELEELMDMNNEIEENFKQTEAALREDIDMKESELRALGTRAEHLSAVVNDRENTILKFRNLVQQLKEEIEGLKSAQQIDSLSSSVADLRKESEDLQVGSTLSFSQPVTVPQSSVNSEQKSKQAAQLLLKSLECELKDLENKAFDDNLSYVLTYLPDAFSRPTGDLDCIRASVLLPRFSEKINLLVKYVKQKNGALSDAPESGKASSDPSESPAFAINIAVQLLNLRVVVDQVSYILNSCSVEKFLRVGSVYPEMLVHEKAIDALINLFKKDQLDYTCRLDSVGRAQNFFDQLLKAVFMGEKTNLPEDFLAYLAVLQECAQVINLSCDKISSHLNPNLEFDDFLIYLKEQVQVSQEIKRSTRKIKRLFPNGEEHTLAIQSEHIKEIREYVDMIRPYAHVFYELSRETEIAASVLNEGEFLSGERLSELRDQCFSDANKSYVTLKPVPVKVQKYTENIAQLVELGEFEEVDVVQCQQPIYAHAEQTKTELANQTRTAEDADIKASELKEVKLKLRQKEEELSSMNVKIELIEQKSKTVPKAMEEKMRVLRDEVEKSKQELDDCKRTHEITLNGLDQEIKELETSNKELKSKIATFSMRGLVGGLSKYATSTTASKEETAVKVVDSPLLMQELSSLRNALKFSRQEVWRLKGEKMREKLLKLRPLRVPEKPMGLQSTTGFVKLDGGDKSTTLGSLTRQASALVSELDRLCVTPRVVDITKRKPGAIHTVDKLTPAQQLVAMKTHHLKVLNKLETLSEKVRNFTAVEYPLKNGNQANPQNSLFADREELKRIKGNLKPTLIAKIELPKKSSDTSTESTKVFLSREQFFELHKNLFRPQ